MNRRRFTLVEVLTAVAVFSIFMVLIIQFFVAAQRLWHATETETRLSNKAALVFNTIERCIRGAKRGEAPFYMSNRDSQKSPFDAMAEQFKDNGDRWEQDSNAYDEGISAKLIFICRSGATLHSASLGNLYIVGFVQAQDRIQLRVICDQDVNGNGNPDFWTLCYEDRDKLLKEFKKDQTDWLDVTTEELGSGAEGESRVTHNLIDHVTSFEVIPYKLTSSSSSNALSVGDETVDFISYGDPPYALKVKIVLLSDDDYEKWKTLCKMDDSGESAAAKAFREKAERTFSRMIYVGKPRKVTL